MGTRFHCPVWRGLRRLLDEENSAARGDFRFAQRKPAIAEGGALQGAQNTTYCGSRLTCTTESGIFASAVVTKR